MRFRETVGISALIRKCDLAVHQVIDEALKELKLTLPTYLVLSVLEEKCENPNLHFTNAELARRAHLTPQTMIRMLQSLEKDGLIKRSSHQDNLIKKTVILTKKAETLICKAHVKVNEVELKMIDSFKKGELKAFSQSLEKTLLSIESK